MIKPESNAPSQMQPWIRTTDKQIEELERTIARLESLITGGTQPDFAQNFALNNAFTFVRQADDSLSTNASGMHFTGDVVADTSLDIAGKLTVGSPDRQVVDDSGEVIDTTPNFEVVAGQYGINPVTGEGSYGAGQFHMEDSDLHLDVNGLIAGDGLSIDLSNTGQNKRENVSIITVSGDGSLVTFTIAKTDTTLAVYIPGETVTVTGVDPTDYNFVNAFITSVDSSGANLLFTVESTVTTTYVAGGYVTISSYNSTYEGKLSVRGPGPEYYGATVNQQGLFIGVDGGNPLTSTTSITPGIVSAPEVSGDYLKVAGVKVSVGPVAPVSPANGDLWIDPTGSSSFGNAANLSFSGNLLAQSLRSSFASAAARDSAITAPVEGMLCYLEDVNQVTSYVGSAWYPIAGQMPRMHLKLNSTFSITNGSTSTVTGWTTISNNSTFSGTSGVVTVPLAGRYNITFVCIHTANNTTGGRGALIALSSTGVTYRNTLPAPQSAGHSQSVYLNMNSVNMAANDTVTLQAYQNSGATNTLTTDTFFIIEYVGP
jgi:hypothetical protein